MMLSTVFRLPDAVSGTCQIRQGAEQEKECAGCANIRQ